VRKLYSLPIDFDFDYFGNWAAAHSGCNQRKSFILPNPAPAFAIHLAQVQAAAPLAAAITQEIEGDRKRADLVVKVSNAIVAGDITRE
jgi:hypothetical protein